MPRALGISLPEARPDWTILEVWNGIFVGDVVKVTGESGHFRFVNHTTTAKNVTWVTVMGPLGKHQAYRSFREERVSAVRRKTR